MKENIVNLVGENLKKLNVFIDDVIYEKEGSNNYLRIILDSDKIIPLNMIVMATRIINPIIDKSNLINEQYILDIYAKSKGDGKNG